MGSGLIGNLMVGVAPVAGLFGYAALGSLVGVVVGAVEILQR